MGLTQGPFEGTVEYMARFRGVDASINKVTLGEVMNILCILRMTDNRYDTILSCYTTGDMTEVSAGLTQL